MRVAKRVHSLAQEQNDSALMIGACQAVVATHYYLGEFETARQYTMRGLQIWRSGGVQYIAEDRRATAVVCLCYEALASGISERLPLASRPWQEAISLAKELNDTNALAVALRFAALLAHYERSPAEVERLASDLIELSTVHNLAFWLASGEVSRGWARSASGNTAEGIAWIDDGIRDYRATGSIAGCHVSCTKG